MENSATLPTRGCAQHRIMSDLMEEHDRRENGQRDRYNDLNSPLLSQPSNFSPSMTKD